MVLYYIFKSYIVFNFALCYVIFDLHYIRSEWITIYCIVLYFFFRSTLEYITLEDVRIDSNVLYCIVFFSKYIRIHFMTWHYTTWHYIRMDYIVFYFLFKYYIVICYNMSYYIMLYGIILCYIVLYYSMIFYCDIILLSIVLYFSYLCICIHHIHIDIQEHTHQHHFFQHILPDCRTSFFDLSFHSARRVTLVETATAPATFVACVARS